MFVAEGVGFVERFCQVLAKAVCFVERFCNVCS